jgi:FkbH-like protein
MLLREALRLVRFAKLDETKVSLLCSFEPLHLKTYLQATLAERLPGRTPEVVTFGYDQLREGLDTTASQLKLFPALLCLSWEDLHPALSWRGRGKDRVETSLLAEGEARLKNDLTRWLQARQGSESYVVLPPPRYLPLLDSCSPMAMGTLAVEASALMWEVAREVSRQGGRLLDLPACELDYRELLLSGCPLSPERSEVIARRFVEVAFLIRARKKALVVDLDGTLWNGVIGEDGPDGLHCRSAGKGHPFHVFQEFLMKLKGEGILLAFCSKNNPGDVLPFLDGMDMPLVLSDFAAYRCNWDPKSDNIRAIAAELNIRYDAVVFVDDDPLELAEVRERLPEVVTFRTPQGGREWLALFESLQDLFAAWQVSEEDHLRTERLADERRRVASIVAEPPRQEPAAGATAYWRLRDMQLEVTLAADAFEDPRSLELINKTNQFNLTGERFLQHEWATWAETPGAFCWSAKLRDRFGEFGTVCVATGVLDAGRSVCLRQLVLSCRAFGRGVEFVVLSELARQTGCMWVRIPLRDTGRNEPAKRFIQGLGCRVESDGHWLISGREVVAAGETLILQTNLGVRSALRVSRPSAGQGRRG